MIIFHVGIPFFVVCGFRLLNSEIGNDLKNVTKSRRNALSFRLLNSEIGNDLATDESIKATKACFRLLNSEIGNDLPKNSNTGSHRRWFSSP